MPKRDPAVKKTLVNLFIFGQMKLMQMKYETGKITKYLENHSKRGDDPSHWQRSIHYK
jgi:hypothetical protein